MMNIGRQVPSLAAFRAFSSANRRVADFERNPARLLELRTEAGIVYVSPSWWQRIRLQWIFRHFHSVPIQVLSRWDRRLIEELSRSTSVSPNLRRASFTVVGVIEHVRSTSPKCKDRPATVRSEQATAEKYLIKPDFLNEDLSSSERLFLERFSGEYLGPAGNSVQDRAAKQRNDRRTWAIREVRLQQLGALTVLLVVCVTLVLTRRYGISLLPISEQPGNLHVFATPPAQVAHELNPPELHSLGTSPSRVPPATAPLVLTAEKPHGAAPRVAVSAVRKPARPLDPINATSSQPSDQLPELFSYSSPIGSVSQSSTSQGSVALLNPPLSQSLEESVYQLRDEFRAASGPPAPTSGDQSRKSNNENIRSASTVAEPAANVPSGRSERLFVSELPQGHFAYPLISERNLVGELHLRALIGTDGSVKEVTVLSGNPKLAEAGMRAVRNWHYTPHQTIAGPVEVETQIKMSFFGQDAVSITSVPYRTVSELK
jgi:outer membrane biosynthesis protein TonB